MSNTVWSGSVAYAEFFSDAATVRDLSGPSPAFVVESRRGRGFYGDLGLSGRSHLGLHIAFGHERIPMGYRLDARRSDHPGVALPFDIQDLNLTTSFNRVSVGLGVAYDPELGKRIHGHLDVAVLRHFINVGQPYHQGVGAASDTTSVWVMGLDARVFQRSSTWHGRIRIGADFMITRRHAIGLYVLLDLPFGDSFSEGKAILFGLTEYRTTLNFDQRGLIKGLCLSYRYSWPRRSKSRGSSINPALHGS